MNRKNVKFCPKCDGENIVIIVPDIRLMKCVDCGYQASIFPEKTLIKKGRDKK